MSRSQMDSVCSSQKQAVKELFADDRLQMRNVAAERLDIVRHLATTEMAKHH